MTLFKTMPWNQTTQMEQIIRFVMLAQSDRYTFTELCEQFGISRKTGYKHLARYAAGGLPGLACPALALAVGRFSFVILQRFSVPPGRFSQQG